MSNSVSVSLHIDKDIANEVGIPEAMLLDRFFYYSASQIKNNPTLPKDDIWFFIEGGYNALVESLPRASKNKVHRWINSLVQSDCIKAEVRNKYGWNRTYSYKVNEKFETEIIKKLNQISKKSNPVASASHATSSAMPPKQQPKTAKTANETATTATANEVAKKPMAQIDADFQALANRQNVNVEEMLQDAQTVVNEYHYKLYKEPMSQGEMNGVNYAIKEIANKIAENGATNSVKLFTELVWMFHAVFVNKPDKLKFRPSYLNNRFQEIYAEGQNWKQRNENPDDPFRLQKSAIPPKVWELIEKYKNYMSLKE